MSRTCSPPASAEDPRDRVADFRAFQCCRESAPTAARVLDALATATDPSEALLAIRPPARWQRSGAGSPMPLLTAHASPGWPAELERVSSWYEPHLIGATRTPRRAGGPPPARSHRCRLSLARTFLTELTLDPPGATSDEAGVPLKDEDYLILSTIHSAKGQEWRAVEC